MSLTTTLESPVKHWDLSKVVRRGVPSSNEGDNHFSFKRLVGKARRGRSSPTPGGDGDAPPPPPPKDGPKGRSPPSLYSAGQSLYKGTIYSPAYVHLDFAVRSSLSSSQTLNIYGPFTWFVYLPSSLSIRRSKHHLVLTNYVQ